LSNLTVPFVKEKMYKQGHESKPLISHKEGGKGRKENATPYQSVRHFCYIKATARVKAPRRDTRPTPRRINQTNSNQLNKQIVFCSFPI
jgi:hypothetical protein